MSMDLDTKVCSKDGPITVLNTLRDIMSVRKLCTLRM